MSIPYFNHFNKEKSNNSSRPQHEQAFLERISRSGQKLRNPSSEWTAQPVGTLSMFYTDSLKKNEMQLSAYMNQSAADNNGYHSKYISRKSVSPKPPSSASQTHSSSAVQRAPDEYIRASQSGKKEIPAFEVQRFDDSFGKSVQELAERKRSLYVSQSQQQQNRNSSKSPQKNWVDIEEEIQIMKQIFNKSMGDISAVTKNKENEQLKTIQPAVNSFSGQKISSSAVSRQSQSQTTPKKRFNTSMGSRSSSPFQDILNSKGSQPQQQVHSQSGMSSLKLENSFLLRENAVLKQELAESKLAAKTEIEAIIAKGQEEAKQVIFKYKEFIDKLINDKKQLNAAFNRLQEELAAAREEAESYRNQMQEQLLGQQNEDRSSQKRNDIGDHVIIEETPSECVDDESQEVHEDERIIQTSTNNSVKMQSKQLTDNMNGEGLLEHLNQVINKIAIEKMKIQDNLRVHDKQSVRTIITTQSGSNSVNMDADTTHSRHPHNPKTSQVQVSSSSSSTSQSPEFGYDRSGVQKQTQHYNEQQKSVGFTYVNNNTAAIPAPAAAVIDEEDRMEYDSYFTDDPNNTYEDQHQYKCFSSPSFSLQ